MTNTGDQRMYDFISQTFTTTATQYLIAANAIVHRAMLDRGNTLELDNNNHYTDWAVSGIILLVLSLETYLNEIIKSLYEDNHISEQECKNLVKFSLLKKTRTVHNKVSKIFGMKRVSTKYYDKFYMMKELRNDLVHFLPRRKLDDEVNKKLDAMKLLVPLNMIGGRYSSFNLLMWVFEVIIESVEYLSSVNDRDKSFLLVGVIQTGSSNYRKIGHIFDQYRATLS